MYENKEEFLESILGISKPWYIDSIKEETENNEIHIFLDFPKGTKFNCPICNKETTAYDKREKTWRHLDLWQYKTYLHAKVPRIKCCDQTPTIKPPWSREDSHFTLLMEEDILELSKMSTISKVAKYIGEYDTRIWRIIHYWVNKCREGADFSKVTNIGIDETSKKGHNYITSFVNLDTRRVMYVDDGKNAKTVSDFKLDFIDHKGVPENVKNITSDMSLSFEKGIKEHFENAVIITDKFHVIGHINKAVDKVRRIESANNPLLKKLNIYGLKMKIA